MKKYNYLIIGTVIVYLLLAGVLWIGNGGIKEDANRFAYKVEIHQVMRELENTYSQNEQEIITLSDSMTGIFDIHLNGYAYLQKITYLSAKEAQNVQKLKGFYKNQNGVNTSVQPLVTNCGMGYVRFDYVVNQERTNILYLQKPYF